MLIGSCYIELRLFTPQSLKEKRHIIKSIMDRIKNKYNVSIAEVELNDKWQMAGIGIACVSNDSKIIDSTFNSIIEFLDGDTRFDITTIDIETL